jgi:uncharacterized protein
MLFNSFDKRVSGRCPQFVGKVAERLMKGEELSASLAAEGVPESLFSRTSKIIEYISGQSEIQEYPIGIHDRKFAEILVLCPTANCNLRCVYCSGSGGAKGNVLMTWDLAKHAIDFFFNHTISSGPYLLQFHGAGEPLMNFKVVRKSVEYAREIAQKRGQQLLTRTTTNGVLTEEITDWVSQNFDHINISLDGPRDIHDLHRPQVGGKGSYDRVVKTIHKLDQTGKLKRINTVITPQSMDRMEEIIRHIRSLCKAKEVRLLPMSYCGRCELSGLQQLDIGEFESRLQKVFPIAASLKIKIVSLLEQLDYFTEYYCGACGFNMCVSPNGVISTCVEVLNERDAGAEELIVGRYDSRRQWIQIDWEKVARLRTRTYKTVPGCAECVFRTNCSGSCLVRAARKSGTVMSADPGSCKLVKKVLSALLVDMADGIASTHDMHLRE